TGSLPESEPQPRRIPMTDRPLPSFVAFLRKQPLWIKLKALILHPETTPEQIALSFAMGLAITVNPLLGLHTALALGLCVAFRKLHRPLLLASSMINTPWTIVPVATISAYLGNLLLGHGFDLDLSHIRWEEITWRSFVTRGGLVETFHMLKPILGPYLLGGFILSALAFTGGYFAMLKLSQRVRSLNLHIPHLHIPAFHRDPTAKENPHGHALPHEAGPGHAAEAAGGPAEPPGRGNRGR
ncbi:MAG TPA: DUF2062 domain-containing protein, partial [Holophaga sp.]|nr:DUF2062 domain-containing protein [Holophaga sp.]